MIVLPLTVSAFFRIPSSAIFSLHERFRIMDCFLADGLEVIFRLALALLKQGRNDLLLQDMEGVIRVRDDSWSISSILVLTSLLFSSSHSVLSKRDAMQVRRRPRPRVRRGLRCETELQKDEEARERVHYDEGQGEGGRNRASGAFFVLLQI